MGRAERYAEPLRVREGQGYVSTVGSRKHLCPLGRRVEVQSRTRGRRVRDILHRSQPYLREQRVFVLEVRCWVSWYWCSESGRATGLGGRILVYARMIIEFSVLTQVYRRHMVLEYGARLRGTDASASGTGKNKEFDLSPTRLATRHLRVSCRLCEY